ncbi:hypothetical protein HK100_012058 [Physocladia obscura]|uniref:Uncharacterized protein n=1 Tax=Physocladia obscura TaxID=109957 RepID=A0AAD5T1S9_9FUNG|nr:hypothetical protein HK100_012058 [Physocladia obscura]
MNNSNTITYSPRRMYLYSQPSNIPRLGDIRPPPNWTSKQASFVENIRQNSESINAANFNAVKYQSPYFNTANKFNANFETDPAARNANDWLRIKPEALKQESVIYLSGASEDTENISSEYLSLVSASVFGSTMSMVHSRKASPIPATLQKKASLVNPALFDHSKTTREPTSYLSTNLGKNSSVKMKSLSTQSFSSKNFQSISQSSKEHEEFWNPYLSSVSPLAVEIAKEYAKKSAVSINKSLSTKVLDEETWDDEEQNTNHKISNTISKSQNTSFTNEIISQKSSDIPTATAAVIKLDTKSRLYSHTTFSKVTEASTGKINMPKKQKSIESGSLLNKTMKSAAIGPTELKQSGFKSTKIKTASSKAKKTEKINVILDSEPSQPQWQ